MKRLVVNADDFGFTRDVNRGIIEAHQHGILTATTLMATGAAFDDAVRLARENPSLDVGCHLVLVGEPPFPPTVARLTASIALGQIAIYETLANQIRRIINAGIRPTHLDTHKHTHLLPPVLDTVARLSEEFRIPWVRRPFDLPLAYGAVPVSVKASAATMRRMQGRFSRVLGRHHCRSTDHFAGFQITGRYDSAALASLIRQLPEGVTEFMCHPGISGSELKTARTRLKESRERELRALTAPEVQSALVESGVELVRYRDL